MLNEILINKIINLIIPYKFEKIFVLGSKNDIDQMKSILSYYNYQKQNKF